MPIVGARTRVSLDVELDKFFDPGCWRRSKEKGTLWRTYRGLTLSVFKNDRGYVWSIADRTGPTYAHKAYATESEAQIQLAIELFQTEIDQERIAVRAQCMLSRRKAKGDE